MFQQIQDLSPEQVSLSFKVLSFPVGSLVELPSSLKSLSQDQWMELSLLLLALMREKQFSRVH